MKTVFSSHSELAHIFASRSQDEGRSTNMHFRDGVLYSYGTAIMRFATNNTGHEYLLVNQTSYSNSTSKHMSHARRATSHISPVFVVGDCRRGESLGFGDNVGGKVFAYAMDQASECQSKASRAKTHKSWLLERSVEWMERARAASEFFGLGLVVDQEHIDKLVSDKNIAAKAHREDMRAAEKRREEANQKRLEELRLKIPAWLAGENVYIRELPTMLRKSRPHDAEDGRSCVLEIETSHGARIPYEDGKRAFKFYMKVRGNGWRRNGETLQVGSYQIDACNPEGIIAGCHRIAHEELIRFAAQEDWL